MMLFDNKRFLIRLIFISSLIFSLMGCVSVKSERKLAAKHTPNRYAQIFLAQTKSIAKVVLRLRPATQQSLYHYYQLFIDNNGPYLIYKNSDIDIYIDEGPHLFRINAITGESQPLGKRYGKETETNLTLNRDEVLILKYVGPSQPRQEGDLMKILVEGGMRQVEVDSLLLKREIYPTLR